MEKYKELLTLVQSLEKDMDKFYRRGNKTAGIRLRHEMQNIRKLAKSIRQEILIINLENKSRIEN